MERIKKSTFGAIRWDAWYPARESTDTSAQCLRALSLPKYHFRAPFFAEIDHNNNVVIPEYNQEIFDREMEYAIEAGIDYFSYVWYDHSGLRMARDFHKKSKYKNQVTLCACIDGNAVMKDYAHKELLQLFNEDFYTKIDNRPLVYYFSAPHLVNKIFDDIAFYKEECKKASIPAPYFVVMGVGADKAKEMGADAISRYSVSARNNIPFTALADEVYKIWDRHSKEGEAVGIDNVLPLVAGWHPHPRFETPVTWMGVDEDSLVDYASAEDIGEHYRRAKEFLQDERNFNSTRSNTAIIYAWNEHDEGGWICPTLKVDENGNQLYDENGNKLIDSSRIEAIKKILKEC